MTTTPHDEPTIGVKLTTIYETVLALQPLIPKVEDHGQRISSLEKNDRNKEIRLTRIETEQSTNATHARENRSDARSRRPNWTAIAAFSLAAYFALRDNIAEFIN